MKKSIYAALAAIIMGTSFIACGSKETEATDTPKPLPVGESFEPTTNIRYYNLDTIMSQYNMCKDFNAVMLDKTNNIEAEQRAKTAELQRMQNNIESKARNNGYLTEQSYNADMQNFQNKYNQAQNYIAALQQEAAAESAAQQQQFLDSLHTFLVDYNKNKRYDAILVKNIGDYYNPALDITQEIVDGLNSRYTSVTPAPETTEAPAAK